MLHYLTCYIMFILSGQVSCWHVHLPLRLHRLLRKRRGGSRSKRNCYIISILYDIIVSFGVEASDVELSIPRLQTPERTARHFKPQNRLLRQASTTKMPYASCQPAPSAARLSAVKPSRTANVIPKYQPGQKPWGLRMQFISLWGLGIRVKTFC